jgi:hypothetical protein
MMTNNPQTAPGYNQSTQGTIYGGGQYVQPGYSNSPVRPGSSVLAPAMLNVIAARKDIPDATGV